MKLRHLVLAAALAGLSSPAPAPAEQAGPPGPTGRMRGVCWEASRQVDAASVAPLRELGVDWISQTPFGWAPSLTAPEVRYESDGGLWGETDDGLAKTAAWARELGIKTLLKPHLWVRHGAWPGEIAMETEAGWKQWFAAYEAFILHYARLAETQGFEALAIGTELGKTTGRTADWKRIVAHVRKVYHGKLTYCANWNDEPERVGFWDDLDFIGVQAYYPLADVDRPSKEAIATRWIPIAAKLAALATRTGKPIVFTEVGFKSHDGSLKEPWQWEENGAVDVELQRDAFSAMFETFWTKPWFGGAFVWKWHPIMRPDSRRDRDFTPQGKPALKVIRAYYTSR
jgi:hypothetical protein